MNEQTLFLIFFLFIAASFHFGNDEFYGKVETLNNLNYDSVTWKLMSISIAALLCAIFWNYYTVNYV